MYQFNISYSLDQYSEEQKNQLVESCPKQVFYLTEDNNIIINNAADCIFCRECIYLLEDYRINPEDKLGVEVSHSTDKWTFTVETTGALTAREVVKDALLQLNAKIVQLQDVTSKLK